MNTSDRIDVNELAGLIWHRKWPVIFFALVGAALGVAISNALPRKYLAEGSVVVRAPVAEPGETDSAIAAAGPTESVVATEHDVLTSTALLRQVAVQIKIPPALLVHKSLMDRLSAITEEAAGLVSPVARQWVTDQFNRLSPPQTPTPEIQADQQEQAKLGLVEGAVSVVAPRGGSVIAINATTPDPQVSADIVNSLLNVYMDYRVAEQNRNNKMIEAALRERLRQTKQAIDDGEAQLLSLLKRPGAIDRSEVPSSMRDVSLLSAQLVEAQAALTKAQAEYNSALTHGTAEGGASASLRNQLADLRQQLAGLAADFGPNYPARQAMQNKVNAMQAEVASENGRGLEQRRAALAEAQATVADLQARLEQQRRQQTGQSSATIGLERVRDSVAGLWRISDALEMRLIDLAARPANSNARILTQAVPPTGAVFPKPTVFGAGGLLAGALLSIIYVLMTSYVYRLRPMAKQLAVQLQVPLLGGLPAISGTRTSQRRLLGSALKGESRDGLAETLRGVALEVEDAALQGHLRCLMVTSGKSGEGKTTVVTALSRSLAMIGMRVLLVDLDLRRPSAEKLFRISAPGALEDDVQQLDPTHRLQVRVDRHSGLHILTPSDEAAANTTRYLRSAELRDLIASARGFYDLLLFDTPPVMAVPDALLVAKLADAILLVSELGRSTDAESEELARRLARTRKPICGVVVTKVDMADVNSGAYSGYTWHRSVTPAVALRKATPAFETPE
jgi:capsular exopolysaccharide synthesis family protein